MKKIRRLIESGEFTTGQDIEDYVDPGQPIPFQEWQAMLQQRNRIISAGLDLCPRCEGLGWSYQDAGHCQMCDAKGNLIRPV